MMKRILTLFVCVAFAAPLSGCLGTSIDSPAGSQAGPSYQTLRWHVVAAPTVVQARDCKNGMSEVNTYVPPWGLAIGILTWGIIVPQWTIFSCASGE
jgi:hypothetical protein